MTDVQDKLSAVVHRVEEVWAAGDADGFADTFTTDATMIVPSEDVYLKGREHIRGYFKAAFSGPLKGSRVVGRPISAKTVTEDVAIVITEGGVIPAGSEELPADNTIRATWVCVRTDGGWQVTAYQNSRTAQPST